MSAEDVSNRFHPRITDYSALPRDLEAVLAVDEGTCLGKVQQTDLVHHPLRPNTGVHST
jgi:hypothetical protein